MSYIAGHLAELLVLAMLCWLAGFALDRQAFRGMPADELRGVRRICLGLGFWITVAFVLATVGQLRNLALAVAAIVVVIAAAWVSLRYPAARGTVALPPMHAWPAVIVMAAALAPLCLLALSPPVSWDASAYHLTLPRLFLAHGGFREVPLNVYSYWPLNVELLFSLALALDDHVLAKLMHFAFGVATLYALYVGCRSFHRPASGPLAAIFLLANGVVAFELRVAYVDLAHAFLVLAGVLFMVDALEGNSRSLWLSGLCCGLAAGVKLSGIVGAGIVGALYLPRFADALRRRESALLRQRLRLFLTRFAAPALGLWAPWIARATLLTGNPLYPFFHGWFGGPDWSPELTDRLQAWQSSIGMGRDAIDYLLLPIRVILAGGRGYERFDGELAAFWIVLVPLALWAACRSMLARRCLVVAGLYFVFWSLSSQQTRLLIPALPLLAIAGAIAVVELLDRLPSRRWRRTALAVVFAIATGFMVAGQGPVLAAGWRTLGVYLNASGDLLSRAAHPVYAYVNTKLPPDARLLFLNTNQRFYCHREVIADSFFEASQIAHWLLPATDAAELHRLLSGRGVTHILLEHRHRGAVYPETLAELLRDPRRVEPLYRSEDGRFSVLELR